MANTGKLAGKTLFITGASRGIGKAIAVKAARDGANIVVVAKTKAPHPKLEGTVFTAAEDIEKAGGRCLPCAVDIRDEGSVENAVHDAVKTFGGIDVLINNASAISLTGTLGTSMKRFDLMNSINCRGTFLTSQKCIPYLKQSKNPHILNISPPLNMKAVWFKNHVAYTMAKYAMSMCVLGMSEELRPYGIGVNALWPRTAIWTAAMKMLGGGEHVASACRKPEIMADAAYAILIRDSKNFTGHFYVDEEVLRELGVTDFDSYAVKPGHPLQSDFFLDDPKPTLTRRSAGAGLNAEATDVTKETYNIFARLREQITSELVHQTKATFLFNIVDLSPNKWYLELKTNGSCGEGKPPEGDSSVDVDFTMNGETFVSLFNGQLSPKVAFMNGQMKIIGNMATALKLEKLLSHLNR
ncbi:hydroxysteroid dehydrogenase protein 2 like [Trichuris trichiura]|uniref:Hydroxysteroid dehydrogenase-like protein 2 n=1 Tax=Trichuris trichiura TaxID=36087 RepID=A0A077Z0R7_TRITR|nr:hydroxysteroid dehydrogenase protein 2 like [Trichuris trichiura]